MNENSSNLRKIFQLLYIIKQFYLKIHRRQRGSEGGMLGAALSRIPTLLSLDCPISTNN